MLKSASFSDIKIGDEVEIEERFPDLYVHLRGTVIRADPEVVLIGGTGPYRSVFKVNADRQILKVCIEQPDPPTEVGSVVKYYNDGYLRYQTAHLSSSGDWIDTKDRFIVLLDRLIWTVLFDAGKDS